MTEAEAKTKWCPFVRVAVGMHPGIEGSAGAFAAVNRDSIAAADDPRRACLCIGAACMAWEEIPDQPEPEGDCSLMLGGRTQ